MMDKYNDILLNIFKAVVVFALFNFVIITAMATWTVISWAWAQ